VNHPAGCDGIEAKLVDRLGENDAPCPDLPPVSVDDRKPQTEGKITKGKVAHATAWMTLWCAKHGKVGRLQLTKLIALQALTDYRDDSFVRVSRANPH
jgi:hypothetical protein